MNQMTEHPLAATQVHAVVYGGTAGGIFRIWLLNIVLNICTLGIYSFWGRTRMRVYVTSQFSLKGDAFEYTGTGGELFKGFLISLPFFIAFSAVSFYTQSTLDNPADDVLVFVLIFFLINVAIYAALRYRYSRTRWRGIRGRMTGSAWLYGLKALGCVVINGLSLGLAIPATDRYLMRYQMGNTWFGDTQGRFAGHEGKLFGTNLVTLLLMPFTLGLSRLWYAAALERYRYANFTVAGVGFRCTYTGGILLGQVLVNLLILIVTLGLGMALVIQRNARIFSENIAVEGDIEAAAQTIRQSTEVLGETGEGLAGIFDADVGIA